MTNAYPFLAGGGEMGALTRQYDWSTTALGTPDTWPQSLRTIVGVILNSRFPMFLWWGEELVQFYNDAYRPSLDTNGKHPSALGQRGTDTWVEVWSVNKPLIDGVMGGGQATWHENQLIPIYRNGGLDNVYWTFSYSPVLDESGKPGGVLVTCQETTAVVAQTNLLQQNKQQLNSLFAQVNAGIAQTDTTGRFTDVNDRFCQLLGYTREELLHRSLADVNHPDDAERDRQLFNECVAQGNGFLINKRYLHKDGTIVWVSSGVSLLVEPDGRRFVTAVCLDISAEKAHERQLAESEAHFRSLIQEAPIATLLLIGRELRVELANELMFNVLGKGTDIIGQTLSTILPEMVGQPYLQLLDEVYTSGKTHEAKAAQGTIVVNGVPGTYYFDYTYKPLFTADGEVYGILIMAVDVTEQVVTRHGLEESENKLRSIIAAAPAGIGLFVGRDLVIEYPNQTFIDIVGKGPGVEGIPLRQAMPELITEGQAYLKILDDVYTTGVPFISPASLVKIVQNGVLNDNYYNISYTPIRNTDGEVYAILDIAIDVTPQVKAQQALEESESRFQNLLRDATVGLIVLLGDDMRVALVNEAYCKLIGHSVENTLHRPLFEVIPEAEAYFLPMLAGVKQTGIPFSLTATPYKVHGETGELIEGFVDFVYQPYREDDGRITGVMAVVTDVTAQTTARQQIEQSESRYRTLAAQLEEQVQQRTEELASSNEELAASNEELLASYEDMARTNDQLNESNHLLSRSNENLQQFAYVASHDLQEPLRKIQTFGALLQTQYGDQLGDGTDYVLRMQSAAARMSTLIQDLLAFSRIATQQDRNQPTSLTEVVSLVLADLEVLISETEAVINVGSLPTVRGDARQLGQVFQNLISNAIKFRQPNMPPVVDIRSARVANLDLPAGVQPTRLAQFYQRIDVSDNGIGFEQKYADRIFQVFQRLHGKGQYTGTGIGLAICEKVVANHGGAVTATSQPDQGATFSVYLPI